MHRFVAICSIGLGTLSYAATDKPSAIDQAERRIHALEKHVGLGGTDMPYTLQSELGLLRGDVRTLKLAPRDRWREVDQRITQKLDALESRYHAE